ncbi:MULTISPECIES: GNAT family N-acetyltransferase [unclassified Leucobacter]|uniref:GNAT family N-acetyltransferase n=1 Tax=unclassified Leucobacter TaxID=2621730 RepID=UPI000621024A|nr:GNAT family N-acetyltransferase [Leucobacter sp. Ag1]KKI18699.1 GCN5 family acetyltransferase [Leucobacter sp. Ag1]
MTMEVLTVRPDDAEAVVLIRDYLSDVVARWWGRPAEAHEVDRAVREEPADGLSEPAGILLIARIDGAAVGMAGLRFPGDGTAELTKVFARPSARGRGVASALLDRLEAEARARGMREVRLETRSDLVEACRMYERRGYAPVAPFSDSPYCDRWYALPFAAAPEE